MFSQIKKKKTEGKFFAIVLGVFYINFRWKLGGKSVQLEKSLSYFIGRKVNNAGYII